MLSILLVLVLYTDSMEVYISKFVVVVVFVVDLAVVVVVAAASTAAASIISRSKL